MCFNILFFCKIQGQSILTNILVPSTPPPTTFAEILSFESDILLQLTNTNNQAYEIKLIVSLTNTDQGISIRLDESFTPSTPLILNPLETKNIKFKDLQIAYDNVSEKDVIAEGINYAQIMREERLPEGDYEICVEVLDYHTNQLLSTSFSCSFFPIIAYDAPIILSPDNEQNIEPSSPTNVLFTWTPSGVIGKTKYRFQLTNATDYGFQNPLDVLVFQDQTFAFTIDDIMYTQLLYNPNYPPLEPGMTYAVRVQAYDDDNAFNYVNNGWSEPIVFTYTTITTFDPQIISNQGSTEPSFSMTECTSFTDPISTEFNTGVTSGQTVQVGDFTMLINQIQLNTSTSTYSGEGTIHLDFAEQNVNVEFENIKINSNLRMFGEESFIVASNENNAIIHSATSEEWSSEVTINYPENFYSYLNQRRAGSPSSLGVPFLLYESEIIICAVQFKPESAYMKVAKSYAFPLAGVGYDPFITYTNNSICINSSGQLSPNTELRLIEDLNIPILSERMKLLLNEDSNIINLSKNGNTVNNLNGHIECSKQIVRYKNSPSKVQFSFSVNDATDFNFIAQGSIDQPLAIPNLKDIELETSGINIDFSTNQNPPHLNSTFSHIGAIWQGIFIEDIDVTLPNNLNPNNYKTKAEGLAISPQGLSFELSQSGNILPLQQGNIASWPFAIDQLDLSIVDNIIEHSSIEGEIRLPIQHTGGVGYEGFLESVNDELNLNLSFSNTSNIDMDMWVATLDIDASSTITLTKAGSKYQINTDLNGNLGVNFLDGSQSASLSKLFLPNIDFQHLDISGKDIPGFIPDINFGSIGLDNPLSNQMSFGFFEGILEGLNVQRQGHKYGLNLDVGFSLFGGDVDDGGFGAGVETDITIWSKYNGSFAFDQFELNEITGHLNLGIAEAEVKINIFNNHEDFGNGFRGEASINLDAAELNLGLQFVIQFGKKDHYRYWYFDGEFRNNVPGFPLGNSGVSLFGFGGGGYYNMIATGPAEEEKKRFNEFEDDQMVYDHNPGNSISEFTYLPQNHNYGFRAMTVIGCTVSSSAWNLENNFLMDFSTSSGFSLNTIQFEGRFNMMRDLDQDEEPKFDISSKSTAEMRIALNRLDDDSREFTANMNCELSGLFAATKFNLAFYHRSPTQNTGRKWHIHLGSWSQADPFDDDARITFENGIDNAFITYQVIMKAYFMMGNKFINGTILPPLPSYITDIQSDAYGNGPEQRSNEEYGTMSNALDSPNNATFGIGFGLGAQFNFKLNLLIFKARLKAQMVADLALTKFNQSCQGYSTIGFNGWYVSGQVYAFLEGSIDVRGKIFGRSFKVNLINLKAGASMQAKFPKPNWVKGNFFVGGSILNGRVRIKTRSLGFEKGELCIPAGDFNPLDNLQFVNEIIPEDNTTNVSVFADPRISFAIPKDDIFTVKDLADKEHTYKVDYSVHLKDKTLNQDVPCDLFWYEDQYALRITPKDWLESKHNYEVKIYIKAYEKIGGTFKIIDTRTKTSSFKTKNRPSSIPISDLVQTYPGLGQRYFMVKSDDGSPAKGFVRLNKVNCHDILKPIESSDPQDGYWVKFTNIRTRKSKSNRCYCSSSKKIEFELPQSLLPEEIHRVELIAKDFEGVLTSNTNQLTTEWIGNSHFAAKGVEDIVYEQKTKAFKNKNVYTSHTKTKSLLDDEVQWYAQTSKYQSYDQKLARYSVNQVAHFDRDIQYSRNFSSNNISISGNFQKSFRTPVVLLSYGGDDEPFDHYDILGYRSHIAQVGYVKPILNPQPQFPQLSQSWLDEYHRQLFLWDYDNQWVHELTQGSSPALRSSHYPFYHEPSGMMNSLQRFVRNNKKYERLLQENGFNITLWRPAPPLTMDEIQPHIQGASVHVGGTGLINQSNNNGSHSNSPTTPQFLVYNHTSLNTSGILMSNINNDDQDLGGSISDWTTTNISFLPIIDFTNEVFHRDRVSINLHAAYRLTQVATASTLNSYIQALNLLDQRFMSLKQPSGTYQIRLSNLLGGSTDFNYQF